MGLGVRILGEHVLWVFKKASHGNIFIRLCAV